MENLGVIVALYHSGSFGNHLLAFRKKIKMLFTSQGWSVLGKTVPSFLFTNTSGTVFPIRTSDLVNNIYLRRLACS